MSRCIGAAFALVLFATPATAASICDADGLQNSGSKYRICMPAAGQYNGILVIWAHGFQDANTEVAIPEDQLCPADFCIHQLINDLGFAFATNSYSKTGLAVLQGKADLLDLASIFAAEKGPPRKVYLVGASEGGIITALSLEQHSDVYAAGVAACGPVGNFRYQIDYFGGARATFEYFFPGLIPGDPFDPPETLAANWAQYYQQVVKPVVFAPANRQALDQWIAVAQLPFDASDYLGTVELSVRDVLRYSVVNLTDAGATLGGFPFDNRWHWYAGSHDDLRLNWFVPRASADAAAVTEMNTKYATSGKLARPLITLHTLRDQQVPYAHEPLYALKTLSTGAFLTRHLNIPVDRFGHCRFTQGEALVSFAIMLLYDGVLSEVTGTAAALSGAELTNFEWRAAQAGLRTRRAGSHVTFKLKQ